MTGKTSPPDWVTELAANCVDYVEGEFGLEAQGFHSREWWTGLFVDAIEAHMPAASGDIDQLAKRAQALAGQDKVEPHVKTHRSTGQGRSFLTDVPITIRPARAGEGGRR